MKEAAAVDRENQETVLRLYTLSVEMADRISARRAAANSFFLAVQSAVLALVALTPASVGTAALDRVVLTLVLSGGIVLAIAWWLLLTSYRRLSTAKFAVINDIEAKYFKVRPFTDEWTQLKRATPTQGNPLARLANLRDRYAELGLVEQLVPAAFVVLYLFLAAHFWRQ